MADNFVPLRKQPKNKQSNSTNQISLSSDVIRSRNGIEVDGENIPDPIETFEQMNLPQRLLNFLKHTKKIVKPTPIQMQSIGCLQKSRDIICLSATGTGKTYGYLLPMCSFLWQQGIVHENETVYCQPSCLIVVPTRELMHQVLSVTRELFSSSNIFPIQENRHVQKNENYHPVYQQNFNQPQFPQWNQPWGNSGIPYCQNTPPHMPHRTVDSACNEKLIVGFCGGVPVKDDVNKLKTNPRVVIATPGRLLDLCEKNFVHLEKVNYFTIDECDKILEMGMEEQLRKIVAMVTVQNNNDVIRTSLWSATLPESLERIARSAVINPVYICCGLKNTIPKNIQQDVKFLHTYQKIDYLLDVLRHTPYPPVIVFASSKDKVDVITEQLQVEQFHAAALHSGKDQTYRNNVVDSFRNDEVDILVATDLASRGLDIPAVTHIINYDTPDNIQDYIHRVGRTGRFGRAGHSTTFLTLDCKIAGELKELLEITNGEIPLQLKDVKNFGKKVLCTEMGDRFY